ncbi:hypothetical protein [Streptomyces sp. R33]|uniref:Uncharacterized protein n=1 Tax=Streptomyces sp. R33 TaxID=3238629 RepID=A0AB39YJ16_9ACTN
MASKHQQQEFRVEIDGIALPDELVQRIDAAVRRAVLQELAAANLGGTSEDLLSEGLTISALAAVGGHGTQGIRVRPAGAA